MATPEEDRKVGWGLIGGGLFGAALCIVLIVVGATSTPHQNIMIVVASFFLLLPVYLVGYGIKKIFNAAGAT
jgi:hypothetical protein